MKIIETVLPGLAALQNIHPLFVHFPIAFFLGALFMEAVAVFRDPRLHLVATWMLYLGALSAVITGATGVIAKSALAAADPLGHGGLHHDEIHVHQYWMIATTLFGILLALYLFWINQRAKWVSHRWGLLFGMLILSVLVTLGADRGARLVFEFGTGVNPAILKETPGESRAEDH
jgi:uncharacterized membrane protein